MKKLLISLGVLGMTATLPSMAVSCHFGEEIREPNNLSHFTQSDFNPAIISWITTNKAANEMYNDIQTIIIKYLADNAIVVNSYDLTVLISVDGVVLPKDENIVELNVVDGNSFKIQAWVPSYVTVVTNEVSVEIVNLKINTLSSDDFISSLNALTFGEFNRGVKNLGAVTGEEFNIIVTNMVNKVFQASPYSIKSPLRGTDYSFEVLTDTSNVIDKTMTLDLTTEGLKNWVVNLNLEDWSTNKWDMNSLSLTITIINGLLVFG